MSAAACRSPSRIGLLALLVLAATMDRASAQTLTVGVAAGALRVQARGLGFIEGVVLDRLKEGRSVRVDFELTLLVTPGGPAIRQVQRGFALSFDLWEERFAVTRLGTPPRSVSHLAARNAETWCLEQLAIPIGALGRYGRDEPFWLRLSYHVPDAAGPTAEANGERFTLRALIDRLSRRGEAGDLGKTIEAGPFRLKN